MGGAALCAVPTIAVVGIALSTLAAGIHAYGGRVVILDEVPAAKDRQQLLASGIAEAFYDEALALAVAMVAAAWIGGWTLALRRRRS